MMNGKILAYSPVVSAGVIQGQDGRPYHFSKSAWSSAEIEPVNGLLVSFDPYSHAASNVSALVKKPSSSQR